MNGESFGRGDAWLCTSQHVSILSYTFGGSRRPDHVSSICTGRPTLIPQIFGYRAAIGVDRRNHRLIERNGGETMVGRSPRSIIRERYQPTGLSPRFQFFRAGGSPIIIIPFYPRFYNCHGNSSVRPFIFLSLYRPSPPPPPLLDSTRRIETGGITGLNDIGFRRRIICLSQTIGLIFLLLIYD